MSFTELLKQTCEIFSHDTTTDAYGDQSLTWSSVQADVKCRVTAQNSNYKSNDGVKYMRPRYKIYIDNVSGLTIEDGYKITVAELNQSFIVTFAKMDSSMHHWELEAEDERTMN